MSGKNNSRTNKGATKREMALAFVVFFSVFFIVGYLRGRSERSSPDRLKIYLGDIIQANKNLLRFGKKDGKTVIRYTCTGNEYWYNVDENEPHKDPANTGTTTESDQLAITKDGAFYTAFVAGTFSAWSIKDLMTFLKYGDEGSTRSRLGLVVAAVAGTVAGYELGYSLATRTPPPCTDAKYAALLQDPNQWRSIEQGVWLERFRELYNENSGFSSCGASDAEVRRVEDENLGKALAKLEQLRASTSKVGYTYSSADFDALDDVAKVKTEYAGRCLNQSPK
jgi:hypothetical protein